MRTSIRIIALMLCLILTATAVFAAEPAAFSGEAPTVSATEQSEATTPEEPDAPDAAERPEPPAEASAEPAPAAPDQPVEQAPETAELMEKPVSEMTDQEIIDKYHLSQTWSTVALIHAVRNGLLAGISEHDLAPKSNTTHAQLATILVRIAGTEKRADLSGFEGVRSSAWYYPFMQRAVSLGLFPIANPAGTVLTPNASATREEVLVALARLFGIHSNNRQGIYQFSDWKEVSDWAANDLSAMIENGFVAGSGDKLMPQDYITREQLAQLLYRQLTKLASTVDTPEFTGRLALTADTVAPNTTIHGDLLLSTDSKNLTLNNLTVTGRLILQGNDFAFVTLNNCSLHELVLCREVEINTNREIPTVSAVRFFRFRGSAQTANVYDRMVLLESSSINTVNAMDQSAMTIVGTVKQMNVLGDHVYINGTGWIDTLTLRGTDLTNRCPTGKTVNNPYRTMEDVTITRTDSGTVSEDSPKITLGLKLNNMPEGWSECDLKWFVNGEVVSNTTRNLVKEGSVVTTQYSFHNYLDGFHPTVPFTVYVTYRGKQTLLYKGYVNVKEPVQTIAANIRTQDVQAKLRANGTLYSWVSDVELKTPIGEYPAGTQVTVLQSREGTVTKVRMQDGKVGWMKYSNVAIINDRYYITQDYSTAVKEYYVNKIRNCTSKTSYLIWVSLYTQRINIFYGSKGNWKLVRSGPIASGRNDCPTPVEVVSILYKTWQWPFEYYYCHHVSVFDEARGFHSRPTRYDDDGGGLYDSTIGCPASAGCIRLMDEDCIYIYQNCPTTTAVYIY